MRYRVSDEDLEAEQEANPTMMRHAQHWDSLRSLAYTLRPFEEDGDEYRKARALEVFKAAVPVVKAMKEHTPEAATVTGHVLLCIVPKLMVLHGCSVRRGSDVAESFGAELKYTIHNLVVRRRAKKRNEQEEHRKLIKKDDGTEELKLWKQTFKVGRVVQAFRRVCVRKAIVDSADYDHLKGRAQLAVRDRGRVAESKKTLHDKEFTPPRLSWPPSEGSCC